MKIARVVLVKTYEETVPGKINDRQERTTTHLETLEVESLITEAEFIQLVNHDSAYAPSDTVSLHEQEPVFVKDAQPDTLKNTQNFKFIRSRFSNVALVALSDG